MGKILIILLSLFIEGLLYKYFILDGVLILVAEPWKSIFAIIIGLAVLFGDLLVIGKMFSHSGEV
jgi:hypothetical protein